MLTIENLHVKFHNRDREAVAGVSLSIADGEILGLVGESGSGKSVTAMSVAGLLPRKQCDYSGSVYLDGVELLHADRSLLRKVQGRSIGVVFQEPQSYMDPLMKIGHQVEEVLRIHTDLTPQARRDRALEAMAAVELPDPEAVYDKYPHQLSGGMCQRASLARALVGHPKVLLLDEPLGALDAFTRMNIQDEILRIWKEHSMSMIMVTHDVDEAVYLSSRVVVMTPRPGRITKIVPVELAQPRARSSQDFLHYRAEILRLLHYGGTIQEPDYYL